MYVRKLSELLSQVLFFIFHKTTFVTFPVNYSVQHYELSMMADATSNTAALNTHKHFYIKTCLLNALRNLTFWGKKQKLLSHSTLVEEVVSDTLLSSGTHGLCTHDDGEKPAVRCPCTSSLKSSQ